MCDGVTRVSRGWTCPSSPGPHRPGHRSLPPTTPSTPPLLLGICDKIAPGQIMGAPVPRPPATAFIAGLASGISNDEKMKVRQQYAAGEVGVTPCSRWRQRLPRGGHHCTFYGTADTNQLVFVRGHGPDAGLRLRASPQRLRPRPHREAARCISAMIGLPGLSPLRCGDRRSALLVNGLAALLASAAAPTASIHMVALAPRRRAGS